MSDKVKLAAPRPIERVNPADALMEQVLAQTRQGGFDPDVWHVMNQRDDELIEQEILHGAGSSKFVYRLPDMKDEDGEQVAGVSVIGARHLAAVYGGIRHRFVSSVRKQGAVFIFTSYPSEHQQMLVTCSVIGELEKEDDFYAVTVEIEDVKKGNSVQMEVAEARLGKKRNGDTFERRHYDRIAQSKAYRNGVLAIIPQDILIDWKLEMLALKKTDVITKDVLAEKRAGVLRFAASKGIVVERKAVEALTFEQIGGLSDAAHEGAEPAFMKAADALGLLAPSSGSATKQQPSTTDTRPPPQEGNLPLGEQPQPQTTRRTRQAKQQPATEDTAAVATAAAEPPKETEKPQPDLGDLGNINFE